MSVAGDEARRKPFRALPAGGSGRAGNLSGGPAVSGAVEGRWCAEDQPSPEFTHFHRVAPVGAWDAGHGGSTPGERGYWQKHIAVEELNMPAMMGMDARTVPPGADGMFMPTRAPSCG